MRVIVKTQFPFVSSDGGGSIREMRDNLCEAGNSDSNSVVHERRLGSVKATSLSAVRRLK